MPETKLASQTGFLPKRRAAQIQSGRQTKPDRK